MNNDLDDGQGIDLSHYSGVLRRQWKIIVGCVLLGIFAGLAYLQLATQSVTGTATVNVNVISSTPFDNQKPDSQLLDTSTEVQVATSSEVLGAASTALGNNKSVSQMRAATTVTPVTGATVFKISYTAPNKAEAIAGADAIAAAYLDYRSTTASDKVNKVIHRLITKRNSLARDLKTANNTLAHAQTGSPVAVQAESDRELTNIEITSVVAQINQLDSVDLSGGTPISGAAQNPLKYNPSSKIILGGAAMLGLLLGILLAFVANALVRKISDERTVKTAGGGALLSQLRARTAAVPAVGSDLDEIRSLRERLLVGLPDGATLVVMDLTIKDRPSDVAVNLALSMAERGGPIRLVLPDHTDAQLAALRSTLELEPTRSSPDIRRFVSLRAPGLEIFVTGENGELGAPNTSLSSIVTDGDHPRLMTLISMPPAAPRSSWLAAARLGHSIMLVVGRGETRISAVRACSDELDAVGAVIHGTVLVPGRRTVEMGAAPSHSRHAHKADVAEGDDTDAQPASTAHIAEGATPDGATTAPSAHPGQPETRRRRRSRRGQPVGHALVQGEGEGSEQSEAASLRPEAADGPGRELDLDTPLDFEERTADPDEAEAPHPVR